MAAPSASVVNNPTPAARALIFISENKSKKELIKKG
jgi:hypothetical protein